MTSGELITARRKALNISTYEAAQGSAISQRYWYVVEAGRCQPSLEMLEKFAAELGCRVIDLLPAERLESKPAPTGF